jgi:hypothetical protein
MGHVTIDGLDVSIENARGSVRSGVGPDGKPWSVEMPAHYGYVRGTEGHDGDHVDVYIGPDPGGFRKVWVVDQIDPGTKKFDEHKALIGFDSKPEAMAAYLGGFSDNSGAGRIGEITEMTKEDFVDWVNEGNTEKPLAYGRKRFSQRIDTSANLGPDERYTSERLPSEAAAALGEGNLQPAADVARRVHQAVEASGEAKPKTRDERFKLNKRIKAREAEALADWARRNNLLLNDSEFERKWIEGDRISGQEADVYFDKASKRVIKLSHADLTGSGSVGQSGDVLAYLRGLQLQNELFADDTRLEGLVRLDGELPQIVTSQGFKTSSSLAPASLASFHADTLGPPPQARLCSSSRLEANG